jgi:hypothetical protein
MASNDQEMSALLTLCPDIMVGAGKRALYCGASRWRCFLLDDLLYGDWATDVIEIDAENCRQVSEWYPECRVVQGDIAKQYRIPDYDIVVLCHVLEHIPERDASDLLERLKERCATILCACPVEEEKLAGHAYAPDDHECHLWSVPRGWFAARGFTEVPTGPDRVGAVWVRSPTTIL